MISLAAVAAAGCAGCAALAAGDFAALAAKRRASSGADQPGRRRLRSLLGRIAAPAAPGHLAELIAAAGAPGAYSEREVMGAKLGLAGVGLLLALALAAGSALPSRLSALVVVAAPVTCFMLPDLMLRRRASQRKRLLQRELPTITDRILLAVRAGLPLGRALAGAAEHGHGPLAEEFALADVRVRLGCSRADSLAQLESRCPLAEVVALVAAIARADRHGAPLEPILTALARGARADSQRMISERAQSAAPKIQLIVALLLVPAAICCVAAGMIASLGGG